MRRNLYSSAWSRCRTLVARGVRHPFQAILRLTLLGLVCGQTTMAHIALFAKMHWPVLREPLGFLRDDPPHATTISRTLAGVSYGLQGAWVARVAADQELDAWWTASGPSSRRTPKAMVMVNVLAHDLKLCLAQWPASEKRYEPRVLREQLGRLFEDYPGLRLLTMDERSGTCASGPRTGLSGAGQGKPADGAGGADRRVCPRGTGGATGGDPHGICR